MQRQMVTVPRALTRGVEVDWDIDWRGSPPAENTAGFDQTVYSAMPRWVGSLNVPLVGQAISRWQAVRAAARGRINILLLEMFDPVGFAFGPALADPALVKAGVSWSNGLPFANGNGWSFVPVVAAVGDHAAGSTTLRVYHGTLGTSPVAGQIMSHDDRPFRVVSVEDEGGDVALLTVAPCLRAAVTDGDAVRMRGRGRFQMLEDTAGAATYGVARQSRIQMTLREVINR